MLGKLRRHVQVQLAGLNVDRLTISALDLSNKDPVQIVLSRNEHLRNRASARHSDFPASAQAKHTVKTKERKKAIV